MINPKVAALQKSATLKITAQTKKLVREGRDVVNFAAGEPDFDTPDFIKEAAHRAIDRGETKYTPSTGMPALKEAIAEKLAKENSIPKEHQQVIVTSGAKYALYTALLTLLAPNEEVIVPAPYWVSYPEMIKLAGGTMKPLPLTAERSFKIDPALLKQHLTPQSKVLILNYPSNPTGVTYSEDELREIAAIVRAHDSLFVLSDEIYEKLLYDGRTHTSFAALPGMAERTLTVNGFSKAYAMTGWRVGYLAGPEKIIGAASNILAHTTSCLCSISQHAALAAIQDTEWISKMQKILEQRRDLLFAGLKRYPKLSPCKPEGTFYLFCDIRETGIDSSTFAAQLLTQQLVSCIPAEPFGQEGYLRMSFATGEEQIEKGIARIGAFLEK
ncbi:MAG: aminotransferase class I/II-fold pyridoxal phosphate-dependent enzyme [Candidatus Omnitrophica bacterium]|nr:aminotransferase class I/II-fold pyridoxal phosphate-dependent enzyme [Candidatus Omnitrophota bacterium]